MNPSKPDLQEQLADLIIRKGRLNVSYTPTDGGLGPHFNATINNKWPYCCGSTLENVLSNLVHAHLEMDRRALQEQLNEIDKHLAL